MNTESSSACELNEKRILVELEFQRMKEFRERAKHRAESQVVFGLYLSAIVFYIGLIYWSKQYEDSRAFIVIMCSCPIASSLIVMAGIDLGEIEWYHRLRNELYHNGNGLTVERARVEVYSELAKTLFAGLFGAPLIEEQSKKDELLGDFMAAWINFERALQGLAVSVEDKHSIRRSPIDVLQFLLQTNQVSKADFTEINQMRRIRNEVVHGVADYKEIITKEVVDRLNHYTTELLRRKTKEEKG